MRVDGICGSGQSGAVENGGVENAGVDISARYVKGGQCLPKNRIPGSDSQPFSLPALALPRPGMWISFRRHSTELL